MATRTIRQNHYANEYVRVPGRCHRGDQGSVGRAPVSGRLSGVMDGAERRTCPAGKHTCV